MPQDISSVPWDDSVLYGRLGWDALARSLQRDALPESNTVSAQRFQVKSNLLPLFLFTAPSRQLVPAPAVRRGLPQKVFNAHNPFRINKFRFVSSNPRSARFRARY